MLVEINELKLYIETTGNSSKIPLIWSCGMQSSITTDNIVSRVPFDKISEECFLIRYDPRGRGNSEPDDLAKHHEWQYLAQDMLSIANYFSLDNFVAGGTSMGAATALWAAVAEPKKVCAVILDTPPDGWSRRAKIAKFFKMLTEELKNGDIESFLRRRPKKQHPMEKQEQLAEEAMLRATPLTTLIASLLGGANSDYPKKNILSALEINNLILGRNDLLGHSIDTAIELHEVLKGDLIKSYDYISAKESSEQIKNYIHKI